MKNTFKLKINKTLSEVYFKQCQHIIDAITDYLSSKEIFYRVETDKNGDLEIYSPVIKGTKIQLDSGYPSDNGLMIAELKIGGIKSEQYYPENFGYPDFEVDPKDWFTKGVNTSFDFCTQHMMRVTILEDGLPENHGLSIGVFTKIELPMYFCSFKREENGFTVKVCTRDELIEKYPEIAECFCEELF